MLSRLFGAIVERELRLAARRRIETLLPVAFFIVAASLFPLGVGPEAQILREIGPGVVWVCALLATLLSVHGLYGSDFADGTLEQLLLQPQPLAVVAAAKAAAHWLLTGAPLLLAAPLIGVLFDLSAPALLALVLSLLLGTPVLSLLGSLGAALTLGLRSGGVLLILVVLPLATPVLIFGAGAAGAVAQGLSASGHYSLLGALMIAACLGLPPATAAALRISTE
jgi:heme exporter protein B